MSRADHRRLPLASGADQRLRLQANLENLRIHASAAYGLLGAAVLMRECDAADQIGAASCPGDRASLSSSLDPMTTFHDACKTFSSSFVKKERENGSVYYALHSDCPDWFRSAVMLAHDGELPNDSRYELIREALSSLSDNCYDDADSARDDAAEIALQLLPVYTGELLHWFAEHPARLQDCDDAKEESGYSPETVYDSLSAGFIRSAESTILSLIEEIEENRSSLFNPDLDCKLLLGDSHGIYIPKLWCDDLSEEDAEDLSISWEDVQICQSGPDSELYWESWQSILDSAEITEPATLKEEASLWRLIQNGDLWQIRADVEIPEEWFSV
jgi:hypothetical protein